MSSPGMPAQSPMPQPPMGGTGAASAPRPMMGAGQQALTLIHTALEALQRALPGLPMGSEIHTKVLKVVTELSKGLDNSQGDKAAQIQALAAQARELQANPQQAAMQKMFGAQAGGGQPQTPAMPG